MRIITLLFACLASAGFAADLSFMRPRYGDARYGGESSRTPSNTMFYVSLPPGRHHGITVSAWARLIYSGKRYITTAAFYCPEAIQRFNPDLLSGAGGYAQADGTNLTALGGSVTVSAFPFQPYTDATSSNIWPRGVYTVAGWTSNAVTVTLGGAAATLGPGEFNRNVIPGSSASCVIAGTGLVSVGISRTPDANFFGMLDGVAAEGVKGLTGDSIITNEISFCAWRIRLDDDIHIYRSDLVRMNRSDCLGQTTTNSMPRTARALDSGGIYQFGFQGLGGGFGDITVEIFDVRVLTGYLTDAELCVIHSNGAEEIARRGIPKYK